MKKSKIEKRQAGTKAQQRTKAEVTTSSQNIAKPNVVRSPNFVSTENKIKEFEESKKNGYGRFILNENGKITGVELVTLPDTNNVLIPTDDKV